VTATRDEQAPPVFQPPPGNPRFPLLDSMRGIAALMVVTTHAGLLSGANTTTGYGQYVARLEMALTLFFVVSGFVLYRPYVAQKLGVGRAPRLRNYARNRVLRIVPAYWLALTVLSIYPGLEHMWSGHSWSYYLFLQEWNSDWALHGIKPTWSLTVEVTYYALLPLMAWAMLHVTLGRTPRAKIASEVVFLTLLVAIGVGYRVLIRQVVGDDPLSNMWAFLPGSIDWLAVGMGLAVASAALQSRPSPAPVRVVERWPIAAWAAAAVLFWVAATRIGLSGIWPAPTSTLQWVGVHELYGVIAGLIVAPAVFGHERAGGFVRGVLRNPVLAWLGVISYGIFLYHHPIMEALVGSDLSEAWDGFPMLGLTLATLAFAVACATVSYYVVERPIMRWSQARRRRSEPRAPAPQPEPARSVEPAL